MKRKHFNWVKVMFFSCFSFSFHSNPSMQSARHKCISFDKVVLHTCKMQTQRIWNSKTGKSHWVLKFDGRKKSFSLRICPWIRIPTKRWEKIEKENLLRYWRVDVCSLNLFDLVLIWFDSVPVNRFTYICLMPLAPFFVQSPENHNFVCKWKENWFGDIFFSFCWPIHDKLTES